MNRDQANAFARHFRWRKRIARILKYIWWKPRTGKILKRIAPHIPTAVSVLDIGAGNGLIAEGLARRKGAEMTLIDVIDWNLGDLPLVLYDGGRVPFEDKQFEMALLIDVIHHCEDESSIVREALRVARKVLVVEEAHRNRWVLGWTNISDNLQYILYGMPLGVHHRDHSEWMEFFNESSRKVRVVDRYMNHFVYMLE